MNKLKQENYISYKIEIWRRCYMSQLGSVLKNSSKSNKIYFKLIIYVCNHKKFTADSSKSLFLCRRLLGICFLYIVQYIHTYIYVRNLRQIPHSLFSYVGATFADLLYIHLTIHTYICICINTRILKYMYVSKCCIYVFSILICICLMSAQQIL